MELVDHIRSLGYRVEPFVVRIEGVLDIFLPSGKWRNLRTGAKGRKPLDQMLHLIEQQIGERCAKRESGEPVDRQYRLRRTRGHS